MRSNPGTTLTDVRAVYSGAEADLWELLMGQQVHLGGLKSSLELAERAGIGAGMRGVDLCCCNGAGMRCLTRFREVASMVGVDATEKMIERGRRRCQEEGLADRISFVLADACQSGLPSASADFVWSEDAWCYVADKTRLIAEAARIVKPGGVIAFTDWLEGPTALSEAEAQRLLSFMKFPSFESIPGYARLLTEHGCKVTAAEDTGRFASYIELFHNMIDMQLTYDALRIIGFNTQMFDLMRGEFAFLGELARAGKLAQGRFVARRS
ncbi:MAG: class I SAM-dependent methyltransferase [Candidatus Binataceae bacterium]